MQCSIAIDDVQAAQNRHGFVPQQVALVAKHVAEAMDLAKDALMQEGEEEGVE